MRGKRYSLLRRPGQVGITPADAGKTGSVYMSSDELKDHPRGCGENSKYIFDFCEKVGSPPRMRGKLVGLINGRLSSEDHPRGCGENRKNPCKEYLSVGSPPRMRGKLVTHYFERNFNRITPADAGKTLMLG